MVKRTRARRQGKGRKTRRHRQKGGLNKIEAMEFCERCANGSTDPRCSDSVFCGTYCGFDRTGQSGSQATSTNRCKDPKFVSSCEVNMDPVPFTAGKSKIVLEDTLYSIEPEGEICYGDAISSCLTLTIVMENGWKIGAHINSASFSLEDTGFVPKQTYNPTTLLQAIQPILRTDPNFSGSIRYIYCIGDVGNIYIKSNPLRIDTDETDPSGPPVTRSTMRKIVSSIFPRKITATTQFVLNPTFGVNKGIHKDHRLVIKANGDISSHNPETLTRFQ